MCVSRLFMVEVDGNNASVVLVLLFCVVLCQ